MAIRSGLAYQLVLVKRISSFDCAQDGEPVEPYLADKDEMQFLSVLRFTTYALQRLHTIGQHAWLRVLMNDLLRLVPLFLALQCREIVIHQCRNGSRD
jgi:hypothetical protein